MTAPDTATLRRLLTDWLGHDARPALIATPNGTDDADRHRPGRPPTNQEVVSGLLADPTPLPPAALEALGVPAGTPTATVARLLRWAVEDADGPRCRSYRAASYLIASLDPDDLSTATDSA